MTKQATKRMTKAEKEAQAAAQERAMMKARQSDIIDGFDRAKEIAVKIFGADVDRRVIMLVNDRMDLDDAWLPEEDQSKLEAALVESIEIFKAKFAKKFEMVILSHDAAFIIEDIHDRVFEWGDHAPDVDDDEDEEEDEDEDGDE